MRVDALLQGSDGPTRRILAISNKWVRLAQGNNAGVAATDTVDFVPFHDVPKHKKVTYTNFACDYQFNYN